MKKLIIKIAIIIISVLILAIVVLFIKQKITDKTINDDISGIYSSEAYGAPVIITNFEGIKQEISCGYASIQVMSRFLGDEVTEKQLQEQNDGAVNTSTAKGFEKEINEQMDGEYTAVMYSNLKNSEYMEKIYSSLKNGMPVPIVFSSVDKINAPEEWILHYSVVTGLDVENDKVFVSNTYGYDEEYTLKDFLKATRFETWEDMPLFAKFAVASGIFNKNTLFIIEKN